MGGAEDRPAAATAPRVRLDEIGGRQVMEGLSSALAYLQANQEVVNDLNVFPVPDGDTGSNMYLTLRSAVEDAARAAEPQSAAAVLAAAAHGSLMGARGNSGVILSQVLRGLAAGVAGRPRVDARGLAAALDQAQLVAYKAVMKPTEGTILTVVRAAALAAGRVAAEGADVRRVVEAAVAEAHAAVARTPEQLAVLREAGVVDAGGFGLAVILEGFARALQGGGVGEAVELTPRRVGEPTVRRPDLSAAPPGEEDLGSVAVAGRRGAAGVAPKAQGWGYCTEFLVLGPGLDADALRDQLAPLGESALVVGDAEMVRVHVHTTDPARLIAAAAGRGRLTKLKVEDMSAQHHEVLERAAAEASETPGAERAEATVAGAPGIEPVAAAPPAQRAGADAGAEGAVAPPKPLGVVSVAPGPGFREILLSIGADSVVEGGQTMNPSTQDLLGAVRAANAEAVIILPNNKNVILTAEQVDPLAEAVAVRVVPSRSLPQGISALLALDPDASLEENCARMTESLAGVTTIELTRAVRDSTSNGREIHAGDVIALVDDAITEVGSDTTTVAEAAVAQRPTPPELITVYRGAGVGEAETEALVAALSGGRPGVEVEIHDGGQEHYPFILSLE